MPVAELTHIFRQAAGSMIVRGAHAVKRGEPPSFEVSEGLRRDLFLIERDDPRAALTRSPRWSRSAFPSTTTWTR